MVGASTSHFTNQTGQFLTFTSESGLGNPMKKVRLFNWAKGKERELTLSLRKEEWQVEFPLLQFPNQGC